MTGSRAYTPANGAGGSAAASRPPAFRSGGKRHLLIWWREIDRVLLGLVLLLMGMGAVAVAAASPASAARLSTADTRLPDLYFFWLHLRWQLLGVAVMLATSMLNTQQVRRGAIVLAVLMILALLLVPFMGVEVNGARRWLRIGVQFQPSEFLTPAFAVVLAWILSWKMRDPTLPVVAISGGFLGLIVLLLMVQPNLGSAVLFIGCWLVLVMLAGLPMKWIGMSFGGTFAFMALAYMFYENGRRRIDAFLGGGSAFDQVDLANRTLTGGGWTGQGMWLGTQKMRLPEAHTDYIFSVVGEEFGLAICALLVLMYLAIILRVLVRLVDEEQMFTILSAGGLITLFGGQAFINILVNLQMFPSKGMTLPLVSYGGSSTIALCFSIGMLLAIMRRNPYLSREPFSLRSLFEKEAEK